MMLSDAQWKDLFKAQKDQGISVKSFCLKNQIPLLWSHYQKLLTRCELLMSLMPVKMIDCLK